MKWELIPVVERAARFALNRCGFQSRIVETSIARLHAFDSPGAGALPSTVLLHGIGSAATTFTPTLLRLRSQARRVVALDLPGHGFSDEPNGRLTPEALFGSVRAALDELVEEPMVLIGNSLGGALALRYAMDHPARVRALVLLSPAGARVSQADWDELVGSFKVESAAQARRLLGRLYHRTPWYVPAFASSFRDVLKRAAVRDVLETATLDDLPHPERLTDLTMPVLLIWGRSERVLPPASLDYFRTHLPSHAIIEEPAGFGHCPQFDDPERLASRISEFIRMSSGRS